MFRSEPRTTVQIAVRKHALIIKTQLEVLTKRASILLIDLAVSKSDWNLLAG